MTSTTESDPVSATLDFDTGTPALDKLLNTVDTALGRLLRSNNQCLAVTIRRPAAPDKRLYILADVGRHELFHRQTVDEIDDEVEIAHEQSRRDILRTVYMEGRTNNLNLISTNVTDRLAIPDEAPLLNDTHLSQLHREAKSESVH